ncbi:hypothetical protein AVEN_38477-1 [Araneus ventricosus]|uniref:Uncharacterized protein n=1 Tax=Araneus ventricosus TaxID=182803 RepID=A0A4Y2H3R9_ARAVE|nr:hypothetical protein AVEN_38477-1 [Araneus ventricosus]
MLKFILQKREVSTPFKRFKPSPEVKPRVIVQANKFPRPAQNQENSGRKCQYCGSRHVPAYVPLKAELDTMVRAGVIQEVTCAYRLGQSISYTSREKGRFANLLGPPKRE